MIRKEDAAEGSPRHQPDYSVAVDYRTSAFSPIPKRVMDGSSFPLSSAIIRLFVVSWLHVIWHRSRLRRAW